MDREFTRIHANKGSRPINASPPLKRLLVRETENGSRPVERCLACEAEEGSPRDPCALLAALARQALIAEAELTPKPGLVDGRGSGAHTDLSLALMKRSAFAIEPFIHHRAFQSMNESPSPRLRSTLAATGRAAERAMLRATNGSNTHKGAIWALGLLAAAAAAGRDERPLIRDHNATNRFNLDPVSIARTAGLIASFEDMHSVGDLSHGQIVATKFGVTGARGEASNGFPHIIEVGLPMLRVRRIAHAPEPIARLDALLAIMARLTDTCLLYRGGKLAQQAAQQGATAVLAAGGAGTSRGRERLLALDKRLLDLGVSPGGSADLLSGTLFLDAIERQPTETWTSETAERERKPITLRRARSLLRAGLSPIPSLLT
jgi:triphosphoribosyl-dephospho-CoA synthase